MAYLAVFGHVFEKLLSPLYLLMVCAFSGGGDVRGGAGSITTLPSLSILEGGPFCAQVRQVPE